MSEGWLCETKPGMPCPVPGREQRAEGSRHLAARQRAGVLVPTYWLSQHQELGEVSSDYHCH